MKRILIFIVMLLLLLASCDTNLTFRGHCFGDSLDEVKQSEASVSDESYSELEDRTFLRYKDIEIGGYSGKIAYIFNNNELEQIFYYIPSYGEMLTLEDAYAKIIGEYLKYGTLIKDESLDNGTHKALIKNGKSGLVLVVNASNYCVEFHQDYNKCELFYETLSFTSIYNNK